ncbi:MAG: hypothetical protein OHK0019_23510 [Saprospiraceae bacterium]
MKNKALALGAAILLATGIAFSFASTGGQVCCPPEKCNMEAQTCDGIPCPIEDCPIECCKK